MAGKDTFHQALKNNKHWTQSTAAHDPDLFPTLAKGQHPTILWLGCSDSRIPETTLLGLKPGDVFVHRNIANVLPPTDISSQSVVAYAVAHVKVTHVVVCGHTRCGGCVAALGEGRLGLLDTWLAPLRRLRAEGEAGWDREGLSADEKAVRLAEANVRQGVRTLKGNAEVIDGMRERGVVVHGVIYDVATGLLRELDVEEDELEGKKREMASHTK